MSLFSRIRQRAQSITRGKPDRFITYLNNQASIVVQGTAAFVAYTTDPTQENSALVRSFEHQADDARRTLIVELKRTFVTPIDREDLFSLSRAIDDVMDFAYATTNEMDILNVRPNTYLRSMARLLHMSAEEIQKAMEALERHPEQAEAHAVEVRAIDNRMDKLYAKALAELFTNPRDLNEVVHMMKLREVYRQMYHALESTEQAANIINDIGIKFF